MQQGHEESMPEGEQVTPLDQSEIKKRIGAMAGWMQMGNSLHKKFTLKTFPAAVEFVNSIAATAEKANHHPDINIRYNVVEITLSTHSAGGITDKDFALARQIDELVAKV